MSYQFYAIVDPLDDMNLGGNKELVKGFRCEKADWSQDLKFWEYGDLDKVKEQTAALCRALIEAGFYAFEINHSI